MKMIEHTTEASEAAVAQSALLELLASSLDEALPIVQRADRAADMVRIADLCARIGYLGDMAGRLGNWNVRA